MNTINRPTPSPLNRRGATKTTRPFKKSPAAIITKEEPIKSGALIRGLTLLDILLNAPHPMALADIAQASDLDQSTTLRLLRVLVSARFVLRTAQKMYLPSPKSIRPLPLLHPLERLRRSASPMINDLAHSMNQTVSLVLFLGGERLVLEVAQTGQSLSPYYDYWLQGPLHATGGGKALLLSVDEATRQALLGEEPYSALTPHTITTWALLSAQLQKAQEQGFVVAEEDYRLGLTAVSANIKTWSGAVIGCLTATGLAKDFHGGNQQRIGVALKRTADLLMFQLSALDEAQKFCGG